MWWGGGERMLNREGMGREGGNGVRGRVGGTLFEIICGIGGKSHRNFQFYH